MVVKSIIAEIMFENIYTYIHILLNNFFFTSATARYRLN